MTFWSIILMFIFHEKCQSRACKNAKFTLQHPIIFGVFASPWTTLKTEKRKFAFSWEMESVPGHLNCFCLKGRGKFWKMTPLLCACAVVITLETQNVEKRHLASSYLTFFTNRNRQKRFSQNEKKGRYLQKLPQLNVAWGLSYDLSVMILPRFFDFERPLLSPWAKYSDPTFYSQEHVEQKCQILLR